MVGYFVLGLCLAGFVGIGVGFAVSKLRLRWPDKKKYHRTSATYRGRKVTVLIPRSIPSTSPQRKDLAMRCAIVNQAIAESWEWPVGEKTRITHLEEVLDWTVAWFKDSREFDADTRGWGAGDNYLHTQAYATRLSAKTRGGGLPMAVIRSKHIRTVEDVGQPYGHEMTHHLGEELQGSSDRAHASEELWEHFRDRFTARYKILVAEYDNGLSRIGD